MRHRPLLSLAIASLGCWPATMPARAASITLRLDHGVLVDLPEGWSLERDDDDDGEGTPASPVPDQPVDATGRERVHVVCATEACKRTLETCTFVLQREPVEGANDAARLAGLYDSALSRYMRIRAVLRSTSDSATIRQTLAPVLIGERDWFVVETDAKTGFKSGLFAETVIDGRYLGAICKTCETGEVRHRSARGMLSTVRRTDPGGS